MAAQKADTSSKCSTTRRTDLYTLQESDAGCPRQSGQSRQADPLVADVELGIDALQEPVADDPRGHADVLADDRADAAIQPGRDGAEVELSAGDCPLPSGVEAERDCGRLGARKGAARSEMATRDDGLEAVVVRLAAGHLRPDDRRVDGRSHDVRRACAASASRSGVLRRAGVQDHVSLFASASPHDAARTFAMAG